MSGILGGVKRVQRCIGILAWLALVFFVGLLVYNSLPYFNAPRTHAFVWEKGLLAERQIWLVALVVHAVAGVVCLLASLLQFFRPLLRRVPGLHRWLGRVYVFSILVLLVPTGIYLAFFSNGGWVGTAGFLILGVLTAVTTWKGWLAMRRKRIQRHVVWMIRSFAMVTTALTFRIEHMLLQEFGRLSPETGFLVALYLSIIGNAIVAECLLWKMRRKKNKTQYQPNTDETKTVLSLPAALS